MRRFAFAVWAILFFFAFQQIGWAWELQPNGAGVKVSWGGEKLAKRPAPVSEQINPSKAGSRYLRIGGDPKDLNRQVGPEEQIQVSTQDLWVETDSGSGKVYRGWLPVGTEFVTVSTNDPTLRKAVWIKRCGNDVLNSEKNAIFFRVQAAPPGQQIVQLEPQPAPSIQVPPPVAVIEEKSVPVTTPKEESWFSKNWLWVLVGIAAIAGIAIAAGGHGGGGSSPSLGPSPPPPGNN